MEYQVPEAAIALKQGAGRLIRSEDDWGVLVVGDTRIVEKPYGKLLWRGLPPFSRIREPAQVIAFFEKKQARSEEHTSELQSLMRISYAVFCLTKKKKTNK